MNVRKCVCVRDPPVLMALLFSFVLRHEPWKASREQQIEYGCVIGEKYPAPMVDLAIVSKRNAHTMASLREKLVDGGSTPPHCRPSDIEEIRQFFWLADDAATEA